MNEIDKIDALIDEILEDFPLKSLEPESLKQMKQEIRCFLTAKYLPCVKEEISPDLYAEELLKSMNQLKELSSQLTIEYLKITGLSFAQFLPDSWENKPKEPEQSDPNLSISDRLFEEIESEIPTEFSLTFNPEERN